MRGRNLNFLLLLLITVTSVKSQEINLKVADSCRCYFAENENLYREKYSKRKCEGSELWKNKESGSYVKMHYDKGRLIASVEFDSLFNVLKETRLSSDSARNWGQQSYFLPNGSIIYQRTCSDTACWEYSWFQNGKLKEQVSIIREASKSISYLSSGSVRRVFTCDYSKNCDCIEKIYDKSGALWFENIYKPLRFANLDSIQMTKLPLANSKLNLIAVGPNKEFDKGKIVSNDYFMNGILHKRVELVSKKKKVTYYDNLGNPIKKTQ